MYDRDGAERKMYRKAAATSALKAFSLDVFMPYLANNETFLRFFKQITTVIPSQLLTVVAVTKRQLSSFIGSRADQPKGCSTSSITSSA